MVKMKLKDPIKIRMLIAETGKSLRQFSKEIDISHAYLSQILSGKYDPSPTVSQKIAKGLNVKVTDIFLPLMVDKATKTESY